MQLTEKVADLGLQPTCSNALAQPVDNLPELLEVLFTACLVFLNRCIVYIQCCTRSACTEKCTSFSVQRQGCEGQSSLVAML